MRNASPFGSLPAALRGMQSCGASALAASLLVGVFAYATRAAAAEMPEPVILGSVGPKVVYVVLGDSTAAGVGGNYDVGLAMSTTRELSRRFQVKMINLAVSGARIRDVRERQLPAAEGLRADVVLLSVGANDVTHLTSIRSMRADLREIVRRLRQRNPDVKIVITGSPDMGSPPRIPRMLRGIASCRTQKVNRMFEPEATKLGLVFAPIARKTGPLFRSDRTLFADDRFHPNDRGYATWLPVLYEALATSTNSPKASAAMRM